MNFGEANQGQTRVGDSEQLPAVNPTEVLEQLCAVLKDHAPGWYTEEQRDRVLAALRLPAEVLVELCALFEDYAPSWYTEEQHDRAMSALRALGLLEGEIDKLI